MRVGIISTLEKGCWGGSELLWLRTALDALAEGDDVAVSLSHGRETVRRTAGLKADGAVIFWRREFRGIVWRQKRKAIGALQNSRLAPIKWMGQWWRRRSSEFRSFFAWKPDVVIVNQAALPDCHGMPDLAYELAVRGVPYVTVIHVANDFHLPDDEARSVMRSVQVGARASLFVAVATQRIAERQLACSLSNAAIVRNPVNIKGCSLLPMPSSEKALFAFVGRLYSQDKGLDVLFEALGSEQWRARQWRLTLYGDGPDREHLRELACHYGIQENVVFAGYAEDIRGVWKNEQILILPSRSESAPLVLVEAMLCGRPAVVTEVGGVTEWVREPDTAFVAEAASASSIGKALERAWLAKDNWEAMGQSAHDVAMSRLDDAPGRALLQVVKSSLSHSASAD